MGATVLHVLGSCWNLFPAGLNDFYHLRCILRKSISNLEDKQGIFEKMHIMRTLYLDFKMFSTKFSLTF